MDGTYNGEMRESCYEVYYISEEGLKLLLAGLGQKSWYGLFSGRSGCSAQTGIKINGILADMYQNGIIDWEGSGVAVRQPYAGMLSAMLEKKTCVTVRISGTASALRCCYLSAAGVVMMLKSQREDDTVGLARMSVRGWIGLLEEECVRLEDGECCKFVCRSSENGQVFRNIRVRRGGLRSYRIEWDEEGDRFLRCAREELGSRLWALFGMDGRDVIKGGSAQ